MLIIILAASSWFMILIEYCDDIDSEWWSWQWRRWRCEGVQMVGFCAKVVPCWCSGHWQWLVPGLLLVSHHHLFCHRICFHWTTTNLWKEKLQNKNHQINSKAMTLSGTRPPMVTKTICFVTASASVRSRKVTNFHLFSSHKSFPVGVFNRQLINITCAYFFLVIRRSI